MRKIFLFLSILLYSVGCNGQLNDELLAQYVNQISVARDYAVDLGGQSNAVGQNDTSTLPTNLKRQFQRVKIWYNPNETDNTGVWQKLRAGVNNNLPGLLTKFGPEIGFADAFESSHPNTDTLYITKFGKGGTTVFNTACPSNWNTSCSGNLAERFMQRWVLDSRAAIPDGTIEVDLGLIWYQGETDGADPTRAAAFLSNTATTLAYYRTQVGISTWPILIVQINYGSVPTVDGQPVRIAQSKKAGNLCDVATYPYNTFFSSDKYQPTVGDEIHIAEQKQFGYDLALHYFPTSSTSPWIEEVQAILNQAKNLNYSIPNATAQAALNTLIQSMKADGSPSTWDKGDAAYLYGYNDLGVSDFSTLNIISPGAFRVTPTGTITFNGSQWKGNGTTGYLNTNFITGINAVNYTLNDASRVFWVSTAHSSNEFYDGTVTVNLNTGRGTLTVGQRINQGGGNLNTSVTMAGTGYHAIDRQNSTDVSVWNNTTENTRTATSTAVPTTAQFILRSGTNFGDAGIRFYYMGASLTDSQHNNLNTYLQTFFTAVGL